MLAVVVRTPTPMKETVGFGRILWLVAMGKLAPFGDDLKQEIYTICLSACMACGSL